MDYVPGSIELAALQRAGVLQDEYIGLSNIPNYIQDLSRKLVTVDYKLDLILGKLNNEED